jgi:hypothetical protein
VTPPLPPPVDATGPTTCDGVDVAAGCVDGLADDDGVAVTRARAGDDVVCGVTADVGVDGVVGVADGVAAGVGVGGASTMYVASPAASWLLAPGACVTIMLISHGPVIVEGNALGEMTDSQSVYPVTRNRSENAASKSYSRMVAPG